MAPEEDERRYRLGLAAVVASSALFSCKSVFFKICYRYGTDPVVLQAMRTACSAPFFVWPLVAHRFQPADSRAVALSGREWAGIIGLGFVGYYLASIFDMVGLKYISAGTERLILYVYPTLVVIFSALIFRKRIPKVMYWPLGLSYAGIALSFGSEAAGPPGGKPYLGGFLVLMSAVFYALFLVGQGRMVHRVGPSRFAAICMLVSGLAVSAHFLVRFPISALVQPAPVYWIAAATSIFCSVVPVYLYGYGVRAVGAGKAAVVSSVGPVSTLVLAGVLLGESSGVPQVAGLALVLAGSLLLGMDRSRPKPAGVQKAAFSAAGPAAVSEGAAGRGQA